jgi:hypothetical protein
MFKVIQKPWVLQVVAKLNYHIHQMHLHNNKMRNVFNGMTHHKLWKIIYITKMLQCEMHLSPIWYQ